MPALNPTGIVPAMPAVIDDTAPHDRDRLKKANG
jgi:hypothetical protein